GVPSRKPKSERMTTMLRDPVPAPQAWVPRDLQQTSWLTVLSSEELADLDAALRAVEGRGLEWPSFGREDFPLTTFTHRIDAVHRALRDGCGFTLLRGLPVERYTLRQVENVYWGIGSH